MANALMHAAASAMVRFVPQAVPVVPAILTSARHAEVFKDLFGKHKDHQK